MVVPVLFFVVAWSYAICVNFVPSYRDPADKIQESGIGVGSASQPKDEVIPDNEKEAMEARRNS
jgi:FHS family L-fucose permease-like MFS transporter